jgi:nucleotide-binding universal stress UspA family protein
MAFKKILCATDFSEGSKRAIDLACRLADEADGEVVLVHAWHVAMPVYAGEVVVPAAAVATITAEAERNLREALGTATAGKRRISSKLLAGQAWSAIVDAAAHDPAIDLIVVGTHGRTGLARILMGSVAEKVVRHAPCSVLVARPDSVPKQFQHVFVPTDFSEEARRAQDLAVELVQPGGRITLMHVVELPTAYVAEPMIPDLYRDLGQVAAKSLAAVAADMQARTPVPVASVRRLGSAGRETLAALDADRSVDLVVIGSHGRTGLSRMVLGSVAEKVVRHAHSPVLVARRRG